MEHTKHTVGAWVMNMLELKLVSIFLWKITNLTPDLCSKFQFHHRASIVTIQFLKFYLPLVSSSKFIFKNFCPWNSTLISISSRVLDLTADGVNVAPFSKNELTIGHNCHTEELTELHCTNWNYEEKIEIKIKIQGLDFWLIHLFIAHAACFFYLTRNKWNLKMSTLLILTGTVT